MLIIQADKAKDLNYFWAFWTLFIIWNKVKCLQKIILEKMMQPNSTSSTLQSHQQEEEIIIDPEQPESPKHNEKSPLKGKKAATKTSKKFICLAITGTILLIGAPGGGVAAYIIFNRSKKGINNDSSFTWKLTAHKDHFSGHCLNTETKNNTCLTQMSPKAAQMFSIRLHSWVELEYDLEDKNGNYMGHFGLKIKKNEIKTFNVTEGLKLHIDSVKAGSIQSIKVEDKIDESRIEDLQDLPFVLTEEGVQFNLDSHFKDKPLIVTESGIQLKTDFNLEKAIAESQIFQLQKPFDADALSALNSQSLNRAQQRGSVPQVASDAYNVAQSVISTPNAALGIGSFVFGLFALKKLKDNLLSVSFRNQPEKVEKPTAYDKV